MKSELKRNERRPSAHWNIQYPTVIIEPRWSSRSCTETSVRSRNTRASIFFFLGFLAFLLDKHCSWLRVVTCGRIKRARTNEGREKRADHREVWEKKYVGGDLLARRRRNGQWGITAFRVSSWLRETINSCKIARNGCSNPQRRTSRKYIYEIIRDRGSWYRGS